MSESIRQSNLFAAEDYKKVFKAYQFIDYTAYDFDTLKQALINYIRVYYPEDFNDYIESSEFIAIIELLAYFGTSLAFRTDLNSRENFIDTAERRESIIRLAQMVNYVPRRNIPASGLFKIAAVETDQPLVDSNGININNLPIYWNDPNNPDWFDQFIQVCNAAFININPFGRPTKSGTIGSIPTDLYQLNNIVRQNICYPITLSVNGQTYPVDICNPDFITNETIFERDPDPANQFNFIYRNDSLGVASANTGFFLYFRQGNLVNIDTNFEFPVPSRVFPIGIQNINQDDVYAQETDQSGNVINQWTKVPELAGENIIYNSIQFAERNIFSVISGANDTVSIRFADGNFGNVPTGLFRFWVRSSANQALVIRPTDAQGLQINIPYQGSDLQTYTLRIVFDLKQTVGNAAPSETDEQIKLRAPEVFSTQSRMVNGSDYNVLPLIYGNQIAKIQALDRTYSGQSRYIDLNDPTGFHRDLIIFGEDGALFRDDQNVLAEVVEISSTAGTIEAIVIDTIQGVLRDNKVSTFFYDEYIPQFEEKIRVNKQTLIDPGYSILDLANPYQNTLYWKTSPAKLKNDTGFFATSTASNANAVAMINSFDTINDSNGTYQPWGMVKSGAVLTFANPSNVEKTTNSASVNSIIQAGIPIIINPVNPYANIGPIELGKEEQNNYQARKIYPAFRSEFNSTEIEEIVATIDNGISFWLYYDLLLDEWHTSTTFTPGIANQIDQPWEYPLPIDYGLPTEQIYSNWAPHPDSGIVYVEIASDSQVGNTTYSISARGRAYVFESYRDVRFYWEPNQIVIDSATGQALQDTIEIMPFVNTNSTINNNDPDIVDPAASFLKTQVPFNITGVYVQHDGHTDTSKVEVSLVDADGDGIPDDPAGFNKIVSAADRIVFEIFDDEVTGYQSTRPWVCLWNTSFADVANVLHAYFPTDGTSPFISTDIGWVTGDSYPTDAVFMDEVDLLFVSDLADVESIAVDVTEYFNSSAGEMDVVSTYFLSKSFLIASTPPGHGIYYSLSFENTDNPVYSKHKILVPGIDKYHFDKNGKVFTQNTTIQEASRLPLYFKWSHYCPVDQRVDPAVTNIIDMIVITESYYRDMIIWKNSGGTLASLPAPPTTEELRVQFQDLNQYKMVSDSMIWNSGKFKILFGATAEPELQATFKVVKAPSSSISDNEVKTRVIQAIDAYFDIRNWDFGEKFFYTELAAFIHQQLSKIISTVVIVPNNATSQFGNLFEIVGSPDELFMSTATVANVQIVANLTDANMRV